MKFANIAAALTLFASSFTYASQVLPQADGVTKADLLEEL